MALPRLPLLRRKPPAERDLRNAGSDLGLLKSRGTFGGPSSLLDGLQARNGMPSFARECQWNKVSQGWPGTRLGLVPLDLCGDPQASGAGRTQRNPASAHGGVSPLCCWLRPTLLARAEQSSKKDSGIPVVEAQIPTPVLSWWSCLRPPVPTRV